MFVYPKNAILAPSEIVVGDPVVGIVVGVGYLDVVGTSLIVGIILIVSFGLGLILGFLER